MSAVEATVLLRWARLADWREAPEPLDRLVSAVERERARGYRHADDRLRSLLGAALVRTAAAAAAGIRAGAVDVVRRCPECGGPHGRPLLASHGLHASLSHSGDWVVAAVGARGPLGVDVERVSTFDPGVLRLVVAPGEPTPADRRAATALWAAKEAVLKLSGDGLARPMTELTIRPGAPGEPAAVTAAGLPDGVRVHRLEVDQDHEAALAVPGAAAYDEELVRPPG